jgi:hypothetical protein
MTASLLISLLTRKAITFFLKNGITSLKRRKEKDNYTVKELSYLKRKYFLLRFSLLRLTFLLAQH